MTSLPIYFYARCAWVPLGEIDGLDDEDVYWNCTNEQNYTFSSYVRFTLSNVPDLDNNYLTKGYHLGRTSERLSSAWDKKLSFLTEAL